MPTIIEKYPWIADFKAKRAAEKKASIGSIWDAYGYALKSGKRIPEWEAEIALEAALAMDYATHVIKGRFMEAEPVIAKSVYACDYAYRVLMRPWPEAESHIIENGTAAMYAMRVLKKRWEPAESEIIQKIKITGDFHPLRQYWRNIVKGRWQQAEPMFKEYMTKPEWYAYKTKYLRGK